MTAFTHHTAPTQFVENGGIRFAYRRFGKSGGVPLVLFQHFTGNMDNWDPAVTEGLARDREVILFNNAGISTTNGETPVSVAGMARDAAAFIDALGLKTCDLLGFSLGGMVAQQLALDRPRLVRKVVLVGTGPQGGDGMDKFSPEVQSIFFEKKYEPGDLIWLDLFFSTSEASQATGRAFLERVRARKDNRDPPSDMKVAQAQLTAVAEWGAPRINRFAYLKGITQPALVINGNDDIILPTINSYHLAQNLPNAELIIYPDANHGSQYQNPERFVAHVGMFLGA
jgi:pimeloyl-ACP methyl ester carboxylesterase